jgi:hypothetical protein
MGCTSDRESYSDADILSMARQIEKERKQKANYKTRHEAAMKVLGKKGKLIKTVLVAIGDSDGEDLGSVNELQAEWLLRNKHKKFFPYSECKDFHFHVVDGVRYMILVKKRSCQGSGNNADTKDKDED